MLFKTNVICLFLDLYKQINIYLKEKEIEVNMKHIFLVFLFLLILLKSIFLFSIPLYLQLEFKDQGYIPIILKGNIDEDQLAGSGCRILSKTEEFSTAKISLEDFPKLNEITDLTIYPAKPDEPLLDESTSDLMIGENYAGCNADAAQAAGIDGTGVIVGILDYYPLNWKHEDFNITGWNTEDLRVLYIWNQQDDSGTHPTGFDFGSEYSKADLMADNGPLINSGSHGTGCTGITAGDGSASGTENPRMGIAPGAEIIYVHKIWDETGTLNAITYFQNKANELNRPIVISYSGGTKYGFADGSDPVSQAFDSFCENGRLAVVACGNYYTTTDHGLGTTTFGNPTNGIGFIIDSYTNSGSEPFDDLVDIVFFYKLGDNFDVTVTDPGSNSYETTVLDEDESFDTAYGKLHIFHSDDASLEVVVTDEVGTVTVGDDWTIALNVPDASYDDEGGNWSSWVYEKNIAAHHSTHNTSDITLNINSSGQDCISVAGHSKTSGSIYSGSSAGLTFDNRQKPEISAPTNAYTADNASANSYSSLGGTSGAAPHAAGALALMLQRFPNITPAQARSQLTDYAFTDTQTAAFGTEPNKRFGYGKLNAFRAVFPQLDVPENVQIELLNNDTEIRISWDNEGFEYKIYSSTDPTADFPGESWTLETTVTNVNEITLSNNFDAKRFFIVTVD